jgi:predicted patatin/cPLA2 family phospholipase
VRGEKMLGQVIANVLHRSGHLRNSFPNRPASRGRTGLFFGPGIQCGAFGAGASQCLVNEDVRNFDVIIGGSGAGAFNGAFYESGQPKICESIYIEDNCLGRFIKKMRFSYKVDIDLLRSSVEEKLDIDAVIRNHAPLFVSVTNLDGSPDLIDAKRNKNKLLDALLASSIAPRTRESSIEIGGRPRVSGALSNPLPVCEAAERFQLTDMLLILNQPPFFINEGRGFTQKLSALTFIRPRKHGLQDAYIHRKARYNYSLRLVLDGRLPNGCRVGIVAPERKISKMCTDPIALKNHADHGYNQMMAAFKA